MLMRRNFYLSLVVLILTSLFANVVFAATLRVGTGQPYQTIQAAVNAAHDFDIIEIDPGTYRSDQPIVINNRRELIILGGDRSKVKVILTDPHQPVFDISNSIGVCIDNISAQHEPPVTHVNCEGAVMWVTDTEHTTISNCELNGCGSYGILAGSNRKINIINNFIHHNSSAGMSLGQTTGYVQGNTIEHNKTQISLFGETELVFRDNILS